MILINSSPKDAIKIFQPFLPIFVPVGVGYLLSVLEAEGIKTRFIDEQIESDVVSLAAEYVKGMKKPYIFGFSVLTATFKNAINVSRELKRLYPDSVVIFGGVHPTAMPEEVLSYGHIDFVIRGEAEKALVDFYRHVKEGRDVTAVSNLSYRASGGIAHNKEAAVIEDLDKLPPFPYHLFTSKRYDLGFVVSSRGCPYNCIFCSNRVTTGKRYRFKNAAAIAEEIEMLHDKYARKYILFLDDNFLVNKGRVYELIGEIKKRGLDRKVTFTFQARGDNVDHKLLTDLYAAGFKNIGFGIETASERIMAMIKKGETVKQCADAVRMAKKIGFYVSATFIYALPTETRRDRMDCVRLSKELDIDMVRYNNATPYPGTELYDIAKGENRLNIQGLYENFISASTLVESPFKKIRFSYLPEGNTENEIRDDILYSHLAFYLGNISKVKKIITGKDKGVGWFSSGEKLAEVARKMPALFILAITLCIKFNRLLFTVALKKRRI